MGKPFAEEIDYLPCAIDWALKQNIKLLKTVVEGNSARQLIVIGSGGSFTAAAFLAFIHERHYLNLSRAITPLEFIAQPIAPSPDKAIAFISAEGKNKDILSAVKQAQFFRSSNFAISLTTHNPLGELLDASGLGTFVSYQMPWNKDGFLATNSLISTMVLIARAYSVDENIVKNELSLIDSTWITECRKKLKSDLFKANYQFSSPIIILHGQRGKVAALDIESKLAEASLATCQIVDFRQFAHGRHLQLSSENNLPLVIALVSPEDLELSNATLEIFPKNVRTISFMIPASPILSEIVGTVYSILLTEALANMVSLDPGQPEVSEFGNKIHNFDLMELVQIKTPDIPLPILNKFGPINSTDTPKYVGYGYEFCEKLEKASFKAIVCDFDGTFCDTARRFDGIDKKLLPEIVRLISAGIKIGFASGRGDSLYKELRANLHESIWPNIILGLYSGSSIFMLSDALPEVKSDERFDELIEWLKNLGLLSQLNTKARVDGGQLGLRIANQSARTRTLAAINYWLKINKKIGWRAFCSSHSIDVLNENIGKNIVVESMGKFANAIVNSEILKLGDSGDFEGNDFELLNQGLSLSVNTVSSLKDTCWNLLSKHYHGSIGAHYYLSSLEIDNGKACFSREFITKSKKLLSQNTTGEICER